MSELTKNKPSMTFYVIAGFFLAWNLVGLFLYYGQMTANTETYIAAGYSAEQIAWIEATPVWANAAYALAVTLGVVASILLLLRNSLAIPAYLASLACILIQDLESFVLRSPLEIWGGGVYAIPVTVLVMAIVEIWYSRSAKAKGWLS